MEALAIPCGWGRLMPYDGRALDLQNFLETPAAARLVQAIAQLRAPHEKENYISNESRLSKNIRTSCGPPAIPLEARTRLLALRRAQLRQVVDGRRQGHRQKGPDGVEHRSAGLRQGAAVALEAGRWLASSVKAV